MKNEGAPLDPETEKKLNLLQRYWLTYKRAYHTLLGELEENEILLKFGKCTEYNTWQLNEALYRYAESSISALYNLYPEKKEFPFVHQFLREWRNENHHKERFDFYISKIGFYINGKRYELPLGYNILHVITFNKRLKKLTEKQFSSQNIDRDIATNATIGGLISHHHIYMQGMFSNYDTDLKKELPEEIQIRYPIYYEQMRGGSYSRFLSERDFWDGKISEN